VKTIPDKRGVMYDQIAGRVRKYKTKRVSLDPSCLLLGPVIH